jgi:ActR/RegA family two-component response regulator
MCKYYIMTNTSGALWILEDEPEIRSLIANVAEKRGFTVREMGTMSEAWTALFQATENQKDVPGYIIADFRMGVDTSEHWMICIKKNFLDTRIVCLSGAIESDKAELPKKGIPLIRKPASVGQVLDLLKAS